jgi:hypothetical protein
MNGLRKTFAIAAAVSMVCLSATGAMAANKLIVKDSTGVTDKFVVTDTSRIGLGTSAPGAGIEIVATTSPENMIKIHGNGTTQGGGIVGYTNKGTNNLPLANDRLGFMYYGAMYNGTAYHTAGFAATAGANWTPTSAPSGFVFSTTPSGTATRVDRLAITSSGFVGIGTTAPATKLDVSGAIRLNSTGAKGACSATNSGALWLDQAVNPNILYICAGAGGTPIWRTITLN